MSQINQAFERFSQDCFDTLEKTTNESELEAARVTYIGRKGDLASLMEMLSSLPIDEKKIWGPRLNELKEKALDAFEQKKQSLDAKKAAVALDQKKNFDVTAYKMHPKGSLHPYTLITRQVEDVFISMGFAIIDGPEVETPFYNFEALNIPADHPARDTHDTFWLKLPGYLLRTHTSSVQIRHMGQHKPPFAICAPGRVYRNEATDATHDFIFNQVEMLLIDKNVSIANLLGLIEVFLQALFNNTAIKIRVRSSYFPFVEPGLEVDMSCPFCSTGCSICKKTCWIEMGGAGLVHPNVLSACKINPEQWGGCAFGFGLERLIMLKTQIPDVRLLKTGKIDFLKQF